ncbi:MAG: PASTA domain-containing protein [Terriglobia bacterium]
MGGLGPFPGNMQTKLLTFFRWLFFGSLLLVSGFVSCLTAMRLAIRGNEVLVPPLVGKTVEEGAHLLSSASLHLKVEGRRFDDKVPRDRILLQTPPQSSQLKRDQTVRVVLSLGEKRLPVPSLEGETIRTGQILLLKRGFTLATLSAIDSATQDKDVIIAQNPPPEGQFAKSLLMSVLVSNGPRPKTFLMPDLFGMEFETVSKKIGESGLKLGDVSTQSLPQIPKGTVLRQSPAAGSRLAEGDTISLEITR